MSIEYASSLSDISHHLVPSFSQMMVAAGKDDLQLLKLYLSQNYSVIKSVLHTKKALLERAAYCGAVSVVEHMINDIGLSADSHHAFWHSINSGKNDVTHLFIDRATEADTREMLKVITDNDVIPDPIFMMRLLDKADSIDRSTYAGIEKWGNYYRHYACVFERAKSIPIRDDDTD